MHQTWHDLLFMHWQIDPGVLRRLIPRELPLDTYDGMGWVAVAPFHMSNIRAHGLPALPGLSRFPELNVRTYVTMEGKPGVFFFSLDAANAPAVWAARTFYRLPYFRAEMSATAESDWIRYSSRRKGTNAEFHTRYRPTSDVELRPRGTFANWATERYCLYTVFEGKVFRAEIHHQQWPLQNAEAAVEVNTMAEAAGISLPATPPLLHFSRRLDVLIWPLQKV